MTIADCRRTRPRASGRGRRSALIAGAEPSIRQLVRTVLEIGGFRVVEAGSSVEVRERLTGAERAPQVIVLDVSLPNFSGLSTLSYVRAETRLARVPVIVLTGLSEPPDHRQFLAAGASAVIAKPFSAQGLLNLAAQFARPA